MTLQYNISVGQAIPRPRAAPATLAGAVVVSVVVHVAAVCLAVLGFGRQVPAAEVPASITVFMPPAPTAAAPEPSPEAKPAEAQPAEAKPAEAKPAEPPPPEPAPDYALPPPDEALAVPDFKAPLPPPKKEEPPPPKKVEASPPKPAPPKPAAPRPAPPPRPPIAAAPQPAPAAPSAPFNPGTAVNGGAPPSVAAPSIAPAWNVQIASWLASHKRYPSAARQRGEEGEVLVRFTVDGDGRVTDVAIAKSSGHPDLDAATLAMLQGATVPPPGAAATRTVRVHYRLDD